MRCFAGARIICASARADDGPSGPKRAKRGVSTKTLTSLKLTADLSRVGATRLMTNPASVPEAGSTCHLMNMELELELIQTQITQKPMLRAEGLKFLYKSI
jgi:hypothetical protein